MQAVKLCLVIMQVGFDYLLTDVGMGKPDMEVDESRFATYFKRMKFFPLSCQLQHALERERMLFFSMEEFYVYLRSRFCSSSQTQCNSIICSRSADVNKFKQLTVIDKHSRLDGQLEEPLSCLSKCGRRLKLIDVHGGCFKLNFRNIIYTGAV